MRVGVTGGTGNISKYVTKYLLEKGNEVVIFNNKVEEESIYRNVEMVVCDRYDREDFTKKVKSMGKMDCLIDMICYEPEHAGILIEALRGKVEHVVFSSTVDVYSKEQEFYSIMEDHICRPRESYPYAYKKAVCERMLYQAAEQEDFRVTMIRPAATYSEGAGASPMVHPLRGGTYHFDRMRKGKKIIIHGDGSSVWTMTHASDVGKAYANAACNPLAFGKAYNVMGDERYSYRQYFDIVRRALGAPPLNLVCIPSGLLYSMMPDVAVWCLENFQYNSIYNNDAAKRDLGFQFTITLEEGARRCISWLDERNMIENSDEKEFAFYDQVIEIYENHAEQMQKEAQKLEINSF